MKYYRTGRVLIIIYLLMWSAVFAQDTAVHYTDITAAAGIDFRYNFGDFTYQNILESSGSGVTILDYDGDGDMDLYMLNGTWLEGISDEEGKVFRDTPNSLYRNNGDGTFTEIGKKAGVDDRHWSMAAGALDYDHDGDVDIFLANYGPNVFYRNNGDGTFTDIAKKSGVQGPDKLNGFTKWSVGVSFWDYNMDGRVDLMVGNFLAFDPQYISPSAPDMMPHPGEYSGQASMLYEQQADGTFKDVTEKIGLYYPQSKCMGLTLFDYDDDGDLDLFQGNDHQENFLFRNDGKQKFSEVGRQTGVAVNDQGIPTGSMHGSIADIDRDGLTDLLVVDLRYGALYRNSGNGIFADVTRSSGVYQAFSGKGAWGAAFFDYDNDGDADIFSANGQAEELILQLPLLLANDGQGHFTNIGAEVSPYFSVPRSGRGAAVWDFDNDGDLDIIVSHLDLQATPVLLRNDGGNKNHWLGMTLVGKGGPASVIGAKVTARAGDLTQVKINQWATTYLSFNDPRLLFGLGHNSAVGQIEIRWPDGEKEYFEPQVVDQYITVLQGSGVQK